MQNPQPTRKKPFLLRVLGAGDGFKNFIESDKCNCVHYFLVFLVYLVFNFISILEIIFGVVFWDKCPLEPMIPIYLIGAGSGCLTAFNFRIICQICWKAKTLPKCVGFVFIILSFMNLGWFFTGNYYVFHIWQPNYVPSLGEYCDQDLYDFAFTVMLVYYSFGLLLLCLPLCIVYLGLLTITNSKISHAGGYLGNDDKVDVEVGAELPPPKWKGNGKAKTGRNPDPYDSDSDLDVPPRPRNNNEEDEGPEAESKPEEVMSQSRPGTMANGRKDS